MSRIIVLDSGPLGLLTSPRAKEENKRCTAWLANLRSIGDEVIIPEIIDYELRRELTLVGASASLLRLDRLIDQVSYLPLTTPAMRRLWQDI